MLTKHLVQSVAALAFLTLAASAHAQRAALVSDADAPIRTPYQETTTTNCSYASCGITFSAVPAGRRREVDFVSCGLVTNPTDTVYYVQLYALNSFNVFDPSPNIFLPTAAYPGGAGRYSINANVLAFYAAGLRPMVYLQTTNRAQEFTCTLSGREVAI